MGNRLSSLGVPSYSYNSSNELTSDSNGSFSYDNNGNALTDAAGRTFTWDFENRLVQAVNPGVGTTTFKYDPFGRRIQKSGPNGTTNYLYDGPNTVVEVDNSGSVLTRFTEAKYVDEWFAEMQSGATTYYEMDGGDSVTSLSSSLGALTNTYTFDSFGSLTNFTGTLSNPFRYTGREFDSETGLHFYRARYYDQTVGRFISEDPIGFGGGTHFYKYARNNPVLLDDPFGLWTTTGYGPQPGASSIVCDGLGGILVVVGSSEDTSCGMGKCIYVHENQHRQDALAASPSICRYQPTGVQVTFSNEQERKASEIAATTVQLGCLANLLNNAKCDHCKAAIQKYVKKAEKYREHFENEHFN